MEMVEVLRQNASAWSLRQMGRELCVGLNWVGPGGKLQICLGMQVVRKLESQGLWEAPDRVKLNLRRKERLPCQGPMMPIEGPLEEMRPIELVRVGSRWSQNYRIWRELLDTHHYLSSGPLCGPQLRYLISSSRGWLGAIALSASARRTAGRDRWIGWSEEARRENLHLIVNNSRLLILPHVRVPNLASHVLSRLSAQVAGDWQERHGYRPVLMESFVDQQCYRGVCYSAANWQCIGLTTGRGRQDARHERLLSKKALWVFPLSKQFRQQLGELSPKRRCHSIPPVTRRTAAPPQDWLEEEFGQCDLGDKRLEKRLRQVASDFFARPGMNIPQACGSRARIKAVYRFFDHPRVNLHQVLKSHYEATGRRAHGHRVILAVQDTTELNYSAHPATDYLGPICDKKGVVGLLLHETMAYNLEGTPLGLIDAQCWTRDADDKGHRHERDELDLEQKESSKWLVSFKAAARLQEQCPQTMVVSVGDREADIYELFVEALSRRNGPKILIRARQERVLQNQSPESESRALWEYLGQVAASGNLVLKLPRRQGRAGRSAELSIRHAAVELKAPKRKPKLGPVKLWAITAVEEQPPAGVEPVRWLLLTTVPVNNLEEAIEKLQWYALRFQIEVYHRTLKSGCKIEERQLGNAQRIESCLAIDLVVAWRITHLTKLGREVPNLPCTVYFEEAQWKGLVAYTTKNPKPPSQPPTLREAVRMMAESLGGFLGRKSDGEPGTETIWRGLQRLDDVAEMYSVMRRENWISPTNRELLDSS